MSIDTPNTLTSHKKLIILAIPLFFSNISAPLTGIVNTAIIGHLPSVHCLGAVALGTSIMSMIYWLCGFLRMTITGVTAQLVNPSKTEDLLKGLIPALVIALSISASLLLIHLWIIEFALFNAQPTTGIESVATQYLSIRFFGLPAVLLTLVLSGFLLGLKKASKVMWIMISTNLCNLVLDFVLIIGLNMNVKGAAIATLIAEYAGLLLASVWAWQTIKTSTSRKPFQLTDFITAKHFTPLLSLNRDMFIRSLCLQLTIIFISFQATKMGATTIATHGVLMQFFILIALGLDAIAHASEVLVGRAKSLNSQVRIIAEIKLAALYSTLLSAGYAALFFVFGEQIVNLITNLTSVRQLAYQQLYLIVILPLIAHWSFLFDGIFIGLTRAKDMRNTMAFSSVLVFLPLWLLLENFAYTGLWLAFLGFLLARGVSLGALLYLYQKNGRLAY